MRTFNTSSFISRLMPSVYMTLSGILFLGVMFVWISTRRSHVRGLNKAKMYGSIMIAIGIILILMCVSAIYDVSKYTVGTQKETAVVTDTYVDVPTDGSSTYLYTLEFSYGDQTVSVKMSPSHRMNLDVGDTLAVYFYPEDIGHTEYPRVVAVDVEKKRADDNMKVGFLSCMIGLFLFLYANYKLQLRQTGFLVNAKVVQVIHGTSGSNGRNRLEPALICEGRNPVTGMRQNFRTYGAGNEFYAYEEEDTVQVYVHPKNSRRYVINI